MADDEPFVPNTTAVIAGFPPSLQEMSSFLIPENDMEFFETAEPRVILHKFMLRAKMDGEDNHRCTLTFLRNEEERVYQLWVGSEWVNILKDQQRIVGVFGNVSIWESQHQSVFEKFFRDRPDLLKR